MPMTPQTYKYPLDLRGDLSTNHVVNEKHVVGTLSRYIVPHAGAFFNDSLVITYNGETLVPKTDYFFSRIDDEATLLTGKAISRLIYIKRDIYQGTVTLDYQCVGERFSTHSKTVMKLISELKHDVRGIHWEDIIDPPDDYQPYRHLHHIHDVYGLTPIYQGFMELSKTIQWARLKEDKRIWMELTDFREQLAKIEWLDEEQMKKVFREHNKLMTRVDDGTSMLVSEDKLNQSLTPLLLSIQENQTQIGTTNEILNNHIQANQAEHDALRQDITDLKSADANIWTVLNDTVIRDVAYVEQENELDSNHWLTVTPKGRFGFGLTVYRQPEFSALHEQLAQVKQRNANQDTRLDALDAKTDATNMELTRLVFNLDELGNRLATEGLRNDEQDRLIEALRAKDIIHENSLDALVKHQNRTDETIQNNHLDIQNRISGLESQHANRLGELEGKASQATAMLAYHQNEIQGIENRIQEAKQDAVLTAVENANNYTNSKLRELTGNADAMGNDLTGIRSRVVDLELAKERLDNATGELSSDMVGMETKVDELNSSQEAQDEKIRRLEKITKGTTLHFTRTSYRQGGSTTSLRPDAIGFVFFTAGERDVRAEFTYLAHNPNANAKTQVIQKRMNKPTLIHIPAGVINSFPEVFDIDYHRLSDEAFIQQMEGFMPMTILFANNRLMEHKSAILSALKHWLMDVRAGSKRPFWIGCSAGTPLETVVATMEETGQFTLRYDVDEQGHFAVTVDGLAVHRALVLQKQYTQVSHAMDNAYNYLINGELKHLAHRLPGWMVFEIASDLDNSMNYFLEDHNWQPGNVIVANGFRMMANDAVIPHPPTTVSRVLECTFSTSRFRNDISVELHPCDSEGVSLNTPEGIIVFTPAPFPYGTDSQYLGEGQSTAVYRQKFISPGLPTSTNTTRYYRLVIKVEEGVSLSYICLTDLKDNARYNPGEQVQLKAGLSQTETSLIRQETRRYLTEQSREVEKTWDLDNFREQPGAEDFSNITVDENNILHATGVIIHSLSGTEETAVFAPSQQIIVTSTQDWAVPRSLVGRKAEIIVRARSADGPNGTIIHSASRRTFITLPKGKLKLILGGLTSFSNYLTVNQNEDYEDALTPRIYSQGGKHSQASITINV